MEALRLLELLLCKCSPAEVTEVPSDTGMICAQNLFADCQRARVGIGRVGQAIRALVHHGEVGESLGHRRMTLAKGFPFGRQGKLQQPLGVCISALTGIVDGEELTGLRRRRVLAAERAVLDGDRPQIELFGFRKTVLHFVDGGEILQTQRHIGVLDAQRFLPDRQRAPEIIFGLGPPALACKRSSDIAELRRYVRMCGTKCFLALRSNAPVQRLRIRVATKGHVRNGQVVHRQCGIGREAIGLCFHDRNGPLEQSDRLDMSGLVLIDGG